MTPSYSLNSQLNELLPTPSYATPTILSLPPPIAVSLPLPSQTISFFRITLCKAFNLRYAGFPTLLIRQVNGPWCERRLYRPQAEEDFKRGEGSVDAEGYMVCNSERAWKQNGERMGIGMGLKNRR